LRRTGKVLERRENGRILTSGSFSVKIFAVKKNFSKSKLIFKCERGEN
jgi:hypothetical protein